MVDVERGFSCVTFKVVTFTLEEVEGDLAYVKERAKRYFSTIDLSPESCRFRNESEEELGKHLGETTAVSGYGKPLHVPSVTLKTH